MMDHFDLEDDNISRASSNRWSVMAFELPGSDILKTGCLKKLKTKKDKFFVLRSTSSSGPARLEYHDSEKKFKAGQLPKRQILLHKCFNINKKSDTRQKNCIALYLVDECFAMIVKDASEMQIWLDLLLEHQHEYLTEDQQPYPHYDYIWQVEIKPKGLGVSKHLCGGYRFCLQDTVCFVRNNSDKVDFEIQMMNIRRCGHKESFFFMELGRHSPTGSGELWMQVDDTHIAQTMHEVLLGAMREPNFRSRSNTSSSGRIRDAEIEPHESRSREGSHGQGSLRNKKKKIPRPGSALPAEIPSTIAQISTSPSRVVTDPFRERGLSNSMEQQRARHDSFTSKKEFYGTSPAVDMSSVKHLEVKSSSSLETPNSYLVMSPTQRSVSPFRDQADRPGSAASDHEPVPKLETGYMDMKPDSVGSAGTSTDPGYIDMSLSTTPQVDKTTSAAALSQMNSGYIPMGAGHAGRLATSAPIPIRQPKEPGYMEMGPSSQPLPQIKEGGSGEAYLPMTPSANSPLPDTDNLRPTKMICYLSDDSMSGDLPKRSFSVGSRPNAKTIRHHTSYVEPKAKEEVTDNGRWQSAPHLIAQKKAQVPHSYLNTDYSLSSSPSHSLFSEDSMMEMDYRPRATSESYRPRTSSVGKILSQSRQRSSSYGQQSKLAQLAHDVRRKVGSFESVRNSNANIDKQLFHRTSNDSIGHLSFSSKASSSESLRLSSRNSEYVDMHFDKSNDTGYIDMSIGTPKSTKSSACHSRSSSNQSLSSSPAIINSFGLKQEPLINVKVIKSGDGNSGTQKSSNLNVSSRSSLASKSPCGSGRESEDESYVPYAPGISGDNQRQESRSGSLSDKITSSRSNSMSSDRRPGSRSGSFGSEKNPESRSNSFGMSSRPGPRSGSFKADQKTHKSSRMGRLSPKTSLVSGETPKSGGDRKVSKPTDDNPYIDYEPGNVDVGSNSASPQPCTKDGVCNTTIVSKSTVQKPNAQIPQYSMAMDPLFSAMLSVKQKAGENEKGECEYAKTLETSSQSKEDTTPPKTLSSENYSYMEYAPDTSVVVDSSLKSPEVARSYFSPESSSRDVKENKILKDKVERQDPIIASKLQGGGAVTESENRSVNAQRRSSRRESGEAVVKQVLPMKAVLLDDMEDDDGYVGLDFGNNKSSSNTSYLSQPPVRRNLAEGTPVDGDLFVRQTRQRCSPVNTGGKSEHLSPQSGLKKKLSTSSLQDQDVVFRDSKREMEKSCESLNLKSPLPPSLTSNKDLQKQASMPCVASEADSCDSIRQEEDSLNRHSCSDLAKEYEEMSLPAVGSKSSSTQQLSSGPTLNYAKLDLGSSEEIPGEQKLRQARHPSSPEESGPPLQGYAEIDFEMSDNLKNARNREKQPVKFSIE